LNITSNALTDAELNIYNSLGETVKHISKITDKHLLIDSKELANGIYFISVIKSDKQLKAKFIIDK
jgi:hypothetical protein